MESQTPIQAFCGHRVRALRHQRNLTSEQLAYRAGITLRHLWRLERNDRPKSWGVTVARLALALGTSTDYLLGLTDVAARPEWNPHSFDHATEPKQCGA